MEQIAKKITIIEEIARETRLLSLNATIEAARAQGYGKGFAVVASEVRTLAQRSHEAAEDINELARTSVMVSSNAGKMLAQLVPDIQKTTNLVMEITAASSEQSSGTEQINNAIQQLDQVIQQNTATAEEMAAMAEELTSQARQLQVTMNFFTVKGLNDPSAPSSSHPQDNEPVARNWDQPPPLQDEHRTTLTLPPDNNGHGRLDRRAPVGMPEIDQYDPHFERY